MPFIAFFALWNVGEWLSNHSQTFAAIGKLSLLIYLIHPLVFQFLIRVIPKFTNNQIVYGVFRFQLNENAYLVIQLFR